MTKHLTTEMKCAFTNTLIYSSKCIFLLWLHLQTDEKATEWLEGVGESGLQKGGPHLWEGPQPYYDVT